MSDDKPVDGPDTPKPHDETQPIGATTTPAEPTPEAAPQTTPQTTPQPIVPPVAQPPRQRFVDRLWGLKSMIAVALAAVILGGVGGAAIAKAGDGGDQRGGFGGRHGGFGHRGGPGGMFGQQEGRGGFGQNGPQRGFGQNGPQGGQNQGQNQLGVVPPTPSPTSTPTKPSKNG